MGIALIIAGIASAAYGVTIMMVNSGSPFYLAWFAIGAVLGGTGAAVLMHADAPAVRALKWIVCGACALMLIACGTMSWRIMTTAHLEPPDDLDYLIVLGAQVRADGTPAESLRHRLERAQVYLEDHPATRVVVSGGQGPNEPCSEAQAMHTWLRDHGIADQRILVEDRSTTTAENIAFSCALIDPAHDRVGVVTNDFHIWRAVRTAQRGGITQAWGVAAWSHPWYLPNNLLRECLAIAKNTILGTM